MTTTAVWEEAKPSAATTKNSRVARDLAAEGEVAVVAKVTVGRTVTGSWNV